jgi:hypothetical protein
VANFYRHPGGQRISGAQVVVDGDTLTVGLYGYLDEQGNELTLVNKGNDLVFEQGAVSGDSRLWKIRVAADARATRETVTDTIYANTTRDGMVQWDTWDSFDVTFRYKKQQATNLVVRPVTADILGGDKSPWRQFQTRVRQVVNTAIYHPAMRGELLEFLGPIEAKPVNVAVYAAKLGAVERAFLLMVPRSGRAQNLLIVISHSFGQQDSYYSGKGYSDPLSPDFIKEVLEHFVLRRWGRQLMAARSDYALLMPVRAKAKSNLDELGPFVEQSGVGAKIIQMLIGMTDGAFGLDKVGLVAFSNGITAANEFIAVGGKGLPIHWAVNQDPAGGVSISPTVPRRKQYLSGHTTAGRPRPGFEFLPMGRWAKEPVKDAQPKGRDLYDDKNYLHTWCMAEYTLYMGMQ